MVACAEITGILVIICIAAQCRKGVQIATDQVELGASLLTRSVMKLSVHLMVPLEVGFGVTQVFENSTFFTYYFYNGNSLSLSSVMFVFSS